MICRGYRGIAFSIIALLALLGGCDAENTLFSFDNEDLDLILGQVVSLQPFPVRRDYLLDEEIAKTGDHLRVFAVYFNGSTQEIALQNTIVTLDSSGEGESLPLTEAPLPLNPAGRKTVTVIYGGQEARYVISVYADTPASLPDSSDPSSGGDGSIILEPQWPMKKE
jgi:hypothetical protein